MKIAVLCGPGATTHILLNYLQATRQDEILVVREQPMARKAMLRFRLKKLGYVTVIGQVAFMLLVPRLLRAAAGRRIADILRSQNLSDAEPRGLAIRDVETVNAPLTIETLKAFGPDVVVVNGTRIIKGDVLKSVSAPFVNIHVGITPAYRGVHGGYWALRNRDAANFGTTVHVVDVGVDTGPILAQVRATPAQADNFATYPILQLAVALPPLSSVLDRIAAREPLPPAPPHAGPSQQWYHPTLWQYLAGLLRGVK